MASQITCVSIVCPIVGSGTDHWKHQSSASLVFVRGIHRWPVNSPYKRPVTRKIFPFDDVIMFYDQSNQTMCCDDFQLPFSFNPSGVETGIFRDNLANVIAGYALFLHAISPSAIWYWWWTNGIIFHVTGPLWEKFTGHRWIPLTKASDAELWCFLCSAPEKKRLYKQSLRWWFETPLYPLWRHSNEYARHCLPRGRISDDCDNST